MNFQCLKLALLTLTLLWAPLGNAEKVDFPEDELARESVLPVFDRPLSVMNRRVLTAGRGEVGLFGSMNLNEPFYSPYLLGLHGAYHFTEELGANIAYYSWLSGNSTYADALEEGRSEDGEKWGWDFSNLPAPEYTVVGNFQYTMYYGKMSLTKSHVLNLSLFVQGGGGIISFSGEGSPVLTAGFGQKFYFNERLALRFDMRLLGFQGPNLVSRDPRQFTSPAKPSDFDNEIFIYTVLGAGISYIF